MSLSSLIDAAFSRVAVEFNTLRGALSNVATSGSYNDLSDKPIVGDGSFSEYNFSAGLNAKVSGIENNAKDDQTGAEIETLLDTKLGSTDWKLGGYSSGVVETFVATKNFTPGTTTALTLLNSTTNDIAQITFDGITQHHTEWSVSAQIVTFAEAIPVGVQAVEVQYFVPSVFGVPVDGGVTAAKLTDLAAILAKLGIGRENLVINGRFEHWDMGDNVPLDMPFVTSGYWAANRWRSLQTVAWAGSWMRWESDNQIWSLVQRSSGQTGTGIFGISTVFESQFCRRFAGNAVTVSFKAKRGALLSSANQEIKCILRSGGGTDEGLPALGNFATGLQADTTAFPLNETETLHTMTFTVPSGTTQLGLQFWWYPVGTAGTSDWFAITDVKIEEGAGATPYTYYGGSYLADRTMCYRYLETSYEGTGSSPGLVAVSNYYTGRFMVGATNGQYFRIHYRVAKRAIASVSVYSPDTGAEGQYRLWEDGTDQPATRIEQAVNSWLFRPSGSTGINAGDKFRLHYVAMSEMV